MSFYNKFGLSEERVMAGMYSSDDEKIEAIRDCVCKAAQLNSLRLCDFEEIPSQGGFVVTCYVRWSDGTIKRIGICPEKKISGDETRLKAWQHFYEIASDYFEKFDREIAAASIDYEAQRG